MKWPESTLPGIMSQHENGYQTKPDHMMTSSNGNIFRVTGHLCGEFTGHRWIPPHKCQWRGALVFSLIWAWINGWVNNREAGDLRRQRAHYDVIVTRWASEARLTSVSTWWRHDMETLFTAGSLWEESHLWIPPTKDSAMRSFDVSLLLAWISSWTKGRVIGNLRPITLMWCHCHEPFLCHKHYNHEASLLIQASFIGWAQDQAAIKKVSIHLAFQSPDQAHQDIAVMSHERHSTHSRYFNDVTRAPWRVHRSPYFFSR